MNEHVERLVGACPFLLPHLDPDDLDLPTVAFGSIGRTLMERRLCASEEDIVFRYFNALAESGTSEDRTVLGTGAIEIFNDSARSQALAREKLAGVAFRMLEEYRVAWGQPDYGAIP